jgi:hypothetical protein
MHEFYEFLLALGGLHDAKLFAIAWHEYEHVLDISVDDVYANFRGLPEYPGLRKGLISLKGVTDLRIDLPISEPVRFFDAKMSDSTASDVQFAFSPAGTISCRFAAVSFPKNEIPGAS